MNAATATQCGVATLAVVLAGCVCAMAAPAADLQTLPENTNAARDSDYFEKLLEEQREQLGELKCQPELKVVRLESVLQYHDQLADYLFFPQVVAVPRCHHDCSFCGDPGFGLVQGRCEADTMRKVPVAVFYYQENTLRYRRVMVTEHVSCKCS